MKRGPRPSPAVGRERGLGPSTALAGGQGCWETSGLPMPCEPPGTASPTPPTWRRRTGPQTYKLRDKEAGRGFLSGRSSCPWSKENPTQVFNKILCVPAFGTSAEPGPPCPRVVGDKEQLLRPLRAWGKHGPPGSLCPPGPGSCPHGLPWAMRASHALRVLTRSLLATRPPRPGFTLPTCRERSRPGRGPSRPRAASPSRLSIRAFTQLPWPL